MTIHRLITLTALMVMPVVSFAAVDAGLLNLAPGDATVLAGVNVDQAKGSVFGQYMLKQMQLDDPGFQKFISDTGFDPTRDLSQMLTATSGDSTANKTLLLGRGTFNPGRIANTTLAEGAQVVNYKGVDLIVHSGTDMMGALAFPDATTAILGQIDAVKAALDRRGSTTPALAPSTLSRINVLAASNDAWFLSTVSPAVFFSSKIDNQQVGPMMQAGLMQSVIAGSGGLKFLATGAAITGQAVARSDKDAQALADVFKFLVSIVQSNHGSGGQAGQFAALLESVQVSATGVMTNLSLNIPEATLEQLFMPGSHKAGLHRVAAVK